MKANKIILVPETHWDREWYLPFQEFRAKLVLLMDKLLDILKTNPNYKNFTFDGQTIPIEDYLEVRPEKEEEIKKYVEEGRLSIGPMYILPDEFLISGESLIRNLLIGHQISERFGKVMKAGYIPDPFGHIAQLPQILQGFDIPSVLFWRGFGNEFEDLDLDMEFIWKSPNNSSSIIAIHLVLGYGSLAYLKTRKKDGIFKSAIRRIKRVVSSIEKFTSIPIVLLNNGSDHHEAIPEIPEIISQWNKKYPDKPIDQKDFEHYISQIKLYKAHLKSFEGELRGGKYAHLLPGVLSTRMWIKQRNRKIEYLFEKYTEPSASMAWMLTNKGNSFHYPKNYILAGLKWLIKNHPHDSICGCSIDQVHNEMDVRFDWAEQIGEEVFKNSMISIFNHIKKESIPKEAIPILVFNPLPWRRKAIVEFELITESSRSEENLMKTISLYDTNNEIIDFQIYDSKLNPRFQQENHIGHKFSFLADLPPLGYSIYYIKKENKERLTKSERNDFSLSKSCIENNYYKLEIDGDGEFTLIDKESKEVYNKFCYFEDRADWGDEYDFSGPKPDQEDLMFTTHDAELIDTEQILDGVSHKILKVIMNLKLPIALTQNRTSREKSLVNNSIEICISLYRNIKRIDFKIKIENQSKDHRIRVLFPSKLRSKEVLADGHFYIVPRDIKLPDGEDWIQKPQPTNHQNDFVVIEEKDKVFSVMNRGLPEYEAIRENDNTITFAITLLRCIEWLSRDDFITRNSNAGPNLRTPKAQCLGNHEFNLSIHIDNKNSFYDSEIIRKGKEFNCPPKILIPDMMESPLRMSDKLVLNPTGVISYFFKSKEKDKNRYLPTEMSFVNISNKNVIISALKKSEDRKSLILRGYNLSTKTELAQIAFADLISIQKVHKVNFLEEEVDNQIYEITSINENKINLQINASVIFNIEIQFKLI
jgi:mannosylglycerate hydrolase